ncbi:30S ribosomal protein S7 [Candidatus Parcubacteria bacterium]|nr:30S ribosomal protein S7 [Candidatus Parcubacteria bacterium]MBI4098988.1 30S ribosomal protein S7 [Candidatus Parcubacteria bacterium]MBI4385349.1 30S ribosomal protein S7 [Candidatus Parcubacteria bacterium]
MRRKQSVTRALLVDPKYGSTLVTKLTNTLMWEGKKAVARAIVYRALDQVAQSTKREARAVLEAAIENASPLVEVRSKRIGGATYQVPREVRGERRLALALRWLIGSARSQKGRSMAEKLAQEIELAAKNEGTAVKKKNDVHRMAEANRAFAHFGW